MKRSLAAVLLASSLAIAGLAHADEPAPTPTPSAAAAAAPATHKSDLDDDLPPDVRAKLSPEQLHGVLIARAAHPKKSDGEPQVTIPLALFAMILGIVMTSLFANYRRERLRYEALKSALERGAQVPPELLMPQRHPRADLRRGIILLAVGAGLLTLLVATGGAAGGAWAVAAIPIFLGIAYMFVHWLEVRQPSSSAAVASYRTPAA